MPITNAEIAEIFNKVADLLEIKGENPFRIRAYRQAALTIDNLPQSVAEMVKSDKDLTALPGIGTDLANKIKIIATDGSLPLLETLEKEFPSEISDLLGVAGLGAKRVKKLYHELGIKSLNDLEKAAKHGKIRELEGFGQKLEESILDSLKRKNIYEYRINLYRAEQIARPLMEYLKNIPGVKQIEIAGSFRRRKETVGDLDILVICDNNEIITKKFIEYDAVAKVLSHGLRRSSILLRSKLQVDLRTFAKDNYGAALLYFTGSKEHNIQLRKTAIEHGLKINEYGVYKGKKKIAAKTEKEIYDLVGLDYIAPELRENRGEIEAAQKGRLPKLITLADIKGDLHAHTDKTDGSFSLEEMIQAAESLGYEYIAITDHSQHVRIANGLDSKQLAAEIAEIDALRRKFKNIEILKGIEVDILEDGSLDLPDAILKELDIVVCSVHSHFKLPEQKQTERIIKAMDNKYFNILGHPTGRLIGEREPYAVNMGKVLEAAKARNCILEINAHPIRLDLNDIHCRLAKEIGVKLAISTDAHSINDYSLMRYGIGQARRGWIEKNDVVNTHPLAKLKKLLKR